MDLQQLGFMLFMDEQQKKQEQKQREKQQKVNVVSEYCLDREDTATGEETDKK